MRTDAFAVGMYVIALGGVLLSCVLYMRDARELARRRAHWQAIVVRVSGSTRTGGDMVFAIPRDDLATAHPLRMPRDSPLVPWVHALYVADRLPASELDWAVGRALVADDDDAPSDDRAAARLDLLALETLAR